MTVRIQYAYLKQQTWLYRRNYPKELQAVLGAAYKQSLKTGDARVAKAGGLVEKPQPVHIAAPSFAPVTIIGRVGCPLFMA